MKTPEFAREAHSGAAVKPEPTIAVPVTVMACTLDVLRRELNYLEGTIESAGGTDCVPIEVCAWRDQVFGALTLLEIAWAAAGLGAAPVCKSALPGAIDRARQAAPLQTDNSGDYRRGGSHA